MSVTVLEHEHIHQRLQFVFLHICEFGEVDAVKLSTNDRSQVLDLGRCTKKIGLRFVLDVESAVVNLKVRERLPIVLGERRLKEDA